MLTVLVCIAAVVAAVCAAIRMEAVWLSTTAPAARAVPAAPALVDEAATGGRPG